MEIKYWVSIGKEKQLNFEGREVEQDVPVGEQHIVYSEVLLCRVSRQAIKGKNKQSTRKTPFKNVPLCKECERLWKAHPDSKWKKWEVAVA